MDLPLVQESDADLRRLPSVPRTEARMNQRCALRPPVLRAQPPAPGSTA